MGGKRRRDLAYTAQKLWEEEFLKQLKEYTTLSRNLILTGGCAYNIDLNTRIQESGLFEQLFISPVSGDCGQSLGAIIFYHPRIACDYPYLGRSFGEINNNKNELVNDVVDELLAHKIIAWYEGRSEIGPRALCHRSFFGLPDSLAMKDRLSVIIKKRELYRPIGPVVPEEEAYNWFKLSAPSPYMAFAPAARENTKKLAPAIVHANGTSRVQTISRETNPFIHKVLMSLKEKTGVPVIMNSSFNLAGEPLVETPADAFRTFELSGVDILYINGRKYVKH